MRALLTLLPLLTLACAPAARLATATSEPTTVYVVRHAEKESGSAPGLTPQGEARAGFYAAFFAETDLAAVYSTDTRRTLATARPLAEAQDLPVTEYASGLDFAAFAKTLLERHVGEAIFVVGHSNTVPLLVNALAKVDTHDDIPHDDYARLYQVVTRGGASAEVREFRVPIDAPATMGAE